MKLFTNQVAVSVLLFLVQFLTCGVQPAHAQVGEFNQPVTIAESKLFEAPNNQIQHFSENITLPPGQEKLELTLTYYNGTATKPGFKWLRVTSSTMSYLTEKQFAGTKSFSVDVSGELSAGSNQIIVEAGGIAGSTFAWRLTALRPNVESIQPTSPNAGATVTVTGKNFCPDPASDTATIEGTPLTCVAATTNSMVFKIPDSFKAGNANLKVVVAGLEAGQTSMNVLNAIAVLKEMSASWVAPGYNVTIYGGPFSPTAAGNRVTIGPFEATVVKAGIQSLEVQAPAQFAGNPWGVHQPVKVWVNGIRARNNLSINCYMGISI